MVKIGFLFAGQGAQCVGMGKDYYENSVVAKKIFEEANEVLNFDLTDMCFNGPDEILRQTINTQVAIFTTSIAILEGVKEKYPDLVPVVNCGLSLGEYSALVSAGVLDFKTALKVVRKRGELMEKAAAESQGAMVSIIGLPENVCSEISKTSGVDIANFNSPEQIVLSGLKENVEHAAELALDKGAKKAVVLNVSGAFHSHLMYSAQKSMEEVLADIAFNLPKTNFIPNVTAEIENDVAKIKEYLLLQVSSSVKWTQTILSLASMGVCDFLEIGPGKVLKGLARRTNRELNVISLEKYSSLSDIAELINRS